jgi:hypothetical protein
MVAGAVTRRGQVLSGLHPDPRILIPDPRSLIPDPWYAGTNGEPRLSNASHVCLRLGR